jgi:hypothetical protein
MAIYLDGENEDKPWDFGGILFSSIFKQIHFVVGIPNAHYPKNTCSIQQYTGSSNDLILGYRIYIL